MKSTKHHFIKRFFALALTVCILLSVVPTARAQGETTPDTTIPSETTPSTTVPDTTVPGTTIPDATVPSTPAPELTTFQKLAAATSLADFLSLWSSESLAQDIEVLTLPELIQLEAGCEAFAAETQEDSAAKQQLLEDLAARIALFCTECGMRGTHSSSCSLAPTLPQETEAETQPQTTVPDATEPERKLTAFFAPAPAPASSQPIITATLFNSDNSKSIALNSPEDGTLIFDGWGYINDPNNLVNSEEMILEIMYSNLTKDTTITVDMDQILYAYPIPENCDSFTPNEPILVNKGTSSYVGGQYPNALNRYHNSQGTSGTLTFKLNLERDENDDPNAELDLGSGNIRVILRFDPVLWNRQDHVLLRTDPTEPILQVTAEIDEKEPQVLKLDDAYSDGTHTLSSRYHISYTTTSTSGVSTGTSGKRVTAAPTDTVKPTVRVFGVNGTGFANYYAKKLTVRVVPPSCTINGTTYTMSFSNPRGANSNYQFTTETKDDGVYITFHDLYVNAYNFSYFDMKFPEIPGLQAGDSHLFTGSIQVWLGDPETGIELITDDKDSKIYVTMVNNDGAALEYIGNRHYAEDEILDGALNMFGLYVLKNSGNSDSDPLTVRMTFNHKNNNYLGVKSVMLMGDPAQASGTLIKYTLMDETGAVYDNNGSPYEITLTHKYTYVHNGSRILFTISQATAGLDLPEGHEYYLKTVEYGLSTVPAGFSYAYGYYSNSPGVIYGEALCGTLDADTVQGWYQIQVFDQQTGKEYENLRWDAYSRLWASNAGTVYLESATATTPTGAYEITAGDSFGLTLQGRVDATQGAQSTYIDGTRFGILLPKGMYINTSTVTATLDGGSTVPVKSITSREVSTTDNYWIIELESGYPLGYFTEQLNALPNGTGIKLDLQVNTAKTVSESVLTFGQRMWIAAEDFSARRAYYADDLYDLNGNGTNRVDSDYVGALVENRSLTVLPQPARMSDVPALTDSTGTGGLTSVTLKDSSDTATYTLDVVNNKGGIARDIAYYIQIPQETFADSSDRIVLGGAGTVTWEGTELMLLYTTDSGLSLDTIADEDASVAWTTTPTDYSKVTMVKLVAKDNAYFTNGSKGTVFLPLAYSGSAYAYCAGDSVDVKTLSSYYYDQGSIFSSGEAALQTLKISTHYTAPEKVITLTAALNGEPQEAGNVKTDTYVTGLDFFYAHSFAVSNQNTYNVTLGDHDAQTLAQNSNTHFKVTAKMNTGNETTVVAGASLGTLAANATALDFTFDLTNGNALTDVTTERYITFDLSSDHVTIPVRIIINRELGTASPTESGITAGKEYLNTGNATSVSVSQDSAFTVQFVTADMNSQNYGTRTLQFSSPLPQGTTIALLDYSFASPRYARYVCTGSDAAIDLTNFKIMGTNTAYTANESASSFTEKLLFIVDFCGAPCGSGTKTVQLTIKGVNGVPDSTTDALTINTCASRSFGISSSAASVPVGSSLTLSYCVTAAGAADSRYNGRKLAFVITEDPSAPIPSDAILYVDGTAYTRNSRGQFIIPLSDAQSSGTYSFDVKLVSQYLRSNAQSCKLNAALWVSATSQAASPLLGQLAAGPCGVSIYAAKAPSLEVISMSDRVLTTQELSSPVTVTYETLDIPADGSVTLEIQKLIGSAYTTNSIYLETVNGSSAHNQGVYAVDANGGSLTLQFNPNLEIENYQLLFTVLDSSGSELITVPYRFIVVNP